MHPAFSVIFFTSASGAGYGLLTFLGLLATLDWLPLNAPFNLSVITLALVLITAGILSSTAHLDIQSVHGELYHNGVPRGYLVKVYLRL